jgi:hypothetical protein
VQQPGARALLLSCGADKSIIFREADNPVRNTSFKIQKENHQS